MRNAETDIAHAILLAIGSRPDVLAWKQTVGTFRAMDNPNRLVKVGTPGMSDLCAVVAVKITPDMVGRTVAMPVAIEVKTATGAQRHAQKLWQHAWEKRGGLYVIAREPSDAVDAVDRLSG